MEDYELKTNSQFHKKMKYSRGFRKNLEENREDEQDWNKTLMGLNTHRRFRKLLFED